MKAAETPAMVRRVPIVMAGAVACVALALQFLASTSLINDHYMHMAWAQQVALGEVPGRDFVDPGMPLQYLLTAATQWARPGPLTEAVLAIGLLSLAAGATSLGVARLTGSTLAGVAAAVIELLLQPRLYSYPKVVVPSMLVLLGLAYARQWRGSRIALGAGIAIAFLFRHDLGGYAAVFGMVLALSSTGPWRARGIELLRLGGMTLLWLLPYFGFVQWAEGLPEHVHNGLEFFGGESRELAFAWPTIRFGAGQDGWSAWNKEDAAAVLFYICSLLPVLTLVLLVLRRTVLERTTIRVVAAVAAMALPYNNVVLREPITVRVPDLAAVIAVLVTWCAVQLLRGSATPTVSRPAVMRLVTGALATLLLLATGVNAAVLGETRDRFESTRLARGRAEMLQRAASVMAAGRDWPWASRWPSGDLPPVIEYINQCTRPDDRLLVTWFAPEFYYFTQRGFAGGHALVFAPSFSAPRDQARTVARLRSARVPVALVNESDRPKLSHLYSQIDQYLIDEYQPIGSFVMEGGAKVLIMLHRGWQGRTTWGPDAWPCQLEPPAG